MATAAADQRIVESRRAVEVETLKAEAEVEMLRRLATQLMELKKYGGKPGMDAYVRNAKLALFAQANRVIVEAKV